MAIFNVLDTIQNALGQAVPAKPPSPGGVTTPWDDAKDAFFKPIKLDPKRWNQIYPYRLLVIDIKTKQIIAGNSTNGPVSKIRPAGRDNTGIVIDYLRPNREWEFRLPITPQQINVTDMFAISTTSTLRGVVEEHNGVKFKILQASGTTGVWPNRPSASAEPAVPSAVEQIFSGTLSALDNLAENINRVIRSATGGHPSSAPPTFNPLDDGIDRGQKTGYFQAQHVFSWLICTL